MLSFFQGYNLLFSSSIFSFYMDWFHSFNCSLLLGVMVFVFLLFYFLMFNSFFFKSKKIEYQMGELMCSLFPTFILLMQMLPSLSLLYYYGLMNIDSDLTLKVIGHQWYWSYDYSDLENIEFDSYMKSLDMLDLGEKRLLDVDNHCILPVDMSIRFCISSADVIHSWALSSLSIKLDAMSGILSIINYNFPIVGIYYGQCSEICGANHSFMPVVVEITLFNLFKNWCLLF